MKLRTIATMVVALLPASTAKNWLLRMCGHAVASNATVGPGLWVRVGAARLGSDARIGPFNVFRDVTTLELGAGSVIGQWNWVSAALPLTRSGAPGTFAMGDEAALTSRHYVDATGGVSIGHHTTVAGVRSTFLTHGIDWKQSQQRVAPIVIGPYCLVGSNVNLVPGARIAGGSVVGMGSTVGPTLEVEPGLILAPRAATVKAPLTGKYFSRTRGYVD